MRRRFLSVSLVSALLTACDSGKTGSGSASCASSIEYDGRTYFGHAADVSPDDLGAELGEARIPPCNDTNGARESGEAVVAVRIEGVSPEIAVAATYSSDVILVRDGYPFDSLPEEVNRLLAQYGSH